MTDSEIIDALGGTNSVAGRFGLTAAAVSLWRTRGISWEYRPHIWKLALEQGLDVPADFLTAKKAAAA
jgi:hypothetical protein